MCCRLRNKFCNVLRCCMTRFLSINKQTSSSIIILPRKLRKITNEWINDYKGSSLNSIHCCNFYLRTLRLRRKQAELKSFIFELWKVLFLNWKQMLSAPLTAKLLTFECIFESKVFERFKSFYSNLSRFL